MYHGATAFTLIPSFAHSHARYLVSMFIAALVMAYTTPLCMDTSDATLELNSTHPSRDFTSRGWNSWHSAKEDSRLTSISARYSSGVKSTVGLRVLNPTLETRMSTLPRKRSEARACRSARLAREDTSHADPVTSSPRARHSATHASTSASVRAHVWTLAPWLASASTIARPSPLVPPVTTAHLPSRLNGELSPIMSPLRPWRCRADE
mmetsp:Transcript_2976/g.12855  ORF Transcript_2976/g.12855 Transcript_2976/m.12855 type:complete len:208 (-) Transcript_2976:33-656(-)